MNRDVPLQRRDRPWVDTYVAVLCGPFEMPSTDEIRRAVAMLADRYPQSRLTWRLDSARRHWRTDRLSDSVVTERDWLDVPDVGAALDTITHDESLDPPLTLIRYPNHIGLKMSHGVGDGRLFLTVISSVLRTAMTGEVAQWPAQPAGRFPLAEAAFRTFGRNPMLVRSAVNDRFQPRDDGVSATVEPRPWSPSQRTIHTSLPRDQADRLFAWGKDFAPAASRFALQISLILRAMQCTGIRISNDVRVIVDLRRYVGWRYIDGNFVAGVPMRVESTMSPQEVSSNIKATMASGRPLANQALASLRGGGTPPPAATSVDPEGLPRVAFTNMGRSPEIECLPFLPNLPPVYAGSIPPDGPHGITFLFGENPQKMSINATFHDNVVDPASVEAVMKVATSDPIGLLSEPRGAM